MVPLVCQRLEDSVLSWYTASPFIHPSVDSCVLSLSILEWYRRDCYLFHRIAAFFEVRERCPALLQGRLLRGYVVGRGVATQCVHYRGYTMLVGRGVSTSVPIVEGTSSVWEGRSCPLRVVSLYS